MNIRVIVTAADDTIQIYDLNNMQLRLFAAQGVEYKLIEMNTMIGPETIYLARVNNDLEVRFSNDEDNEADLVIEGHYEYPESPVLIAEADNGGIYLYVPIEDDDQMAEVTDAGTIFELADIHTSQPYQPGSDSAVKFGSSLVDKSTDSSPAEFSGFGQWTGYAGIGLFGVAVAAVAGSGGGSGSDSTTSNIISGNVAAGPLVDTHDLTLNIYDAQGALIAENVAIQANGDFSVNLGDYTGAILAQVNTDSDFVADYIDEGTGQGKDLDTTLQAMGYVDGVGTLIVNINPVTYLAVKYFLAIHSNFFDADEEAIDSVNQDIGELLGIDDDVTQANLILALDEEGEPTDESNQYGQILAAISGAEASQGKTTEQIITEILEGVEEDDPTSFKSDEHGNDAKESLTEGAAKSVQSGALTEQESTEVIENIFSDPTTLPSVITTSPSGGVISSNDDGSVQLRFKFNRAPAEGEFTQDDIRLNGEAHGGTITNLTVDEDDSTVYWAIYTPIIEGEATIGVPANSYETDDGVLNIDGVNAVVTYDVTAPLTPVLDLADGQAMVVNSNDEFIELTISTTDYDAGDQIQLYLAGEPIGAIQVITQSSIERSVISVMLLREQLGQDGQKIITANVIDRVGNESNVSDELTFTLDTQISDEALQLAITEGQDAYINANETQVDIEVMLGAQANSGDHIEISIDGSVYAVAHTLSTTDIDTGMVNLVLLVTDLNGEGIKQITARLKDEAGNTSPESDALTLTVDTLSPSDPTITLVNDSGNGETDTNTDSITNDGRLDVQAETGTVLEYFVTAPSESEQAGMTEAEYLDYIVQRTPSNGNAEYTVRVVSKDTAGNSSENSITFILDLTSPPIPEGAGFVDSGNEDDGSTNLVSITAPTNTPVDSITQYRYKHNEGEFSTWSTDQPSPSDEGSYSVEVRHIDKAGNVSEVVNFEFILDTTAPETPTLALSNDTGTSGDNITNSGQLTLEIEGNATAEYFVTPPGGAVLSGMSITQYQDYISDRALANDDGEYLVKVIASDGAANTAETTQVFILDTIGPVFDDGDEHTVYVAIDVNSPYSAHATDIYDVTYSLDQVDILTIDAQTGVLSFVANPTEAGSHNVTIIATDVAGNQTSQNVTINVVLNPTVMITDNVIEEVTNGPVIFTFTFSEDVTGFTTDDINVEGGTAGLLQGSGNVYTLTVTPEVGVDDGLVSVNIADDAVSGADSALFVSEASHSQAVDTNIPDAPVITLVNDSGNGEPDTGTDKITQDGRLDVQAENGARLEYYVAYGADDELGPMTTQGYQDYIDQRAASNDDGTYTVRVVVTDNANNTNSSNFEFTLDTTLQITTELRLENDSGNGIAVTNSDRITNDGGILFAFDSTDNVHDIYVTYQEGPESQAMTLNQYHEYISQRETNNDDGQYSVRLVTTDKAGNSVEQTLDFMLDTIAPASTFSLALDTGISSDDFISSSTNFSSFFPQEDNGILEFRLTDLDTGEIINDWQLSFPSVTYDGNFRAESRGIDAAGNTNLLSIDFTRDTTGPDFDNGNAHSVDVVIGVDNIYVAHASDVHNVTYSLEQQDIFTIDTQTGELSFIANPTEANSYRVIIIATDVAGNQTSQDVTVNVALNPTVVITDNVTEDVTSGPVIFTFTFSEDVTGFTIDDITIAGGTAGPLQGSGNIYTLTVTPDADTESGVVSVHIADDTVTGADSSRFVLEERHSQAVDNVAPSEMPNAVFTDTGSDSSDGLTHVLNLETAPTTNEGTETQYRLVSNTIAITDRNQDKEVYDWQVDYVAPTTYGGYVLQVRQVDAAGLSSPVQTIEISLRVDQYIANPQDNYAYDSIESDLFVITFGDIIDGSNVDEILLNQFTLEIDNQIVAINDITTDVNDEYSFNFHTDESFNLHSLSEKVVFTYLPDDNENVRIKDEFGQTHDQGYGVTIYEVFDNGQDYQHIENTMLIFKNFDDNAHVTITGGDHNDSIQGGQADETLIGGAGDDVIYGQIGDDILTGGDGRDVFLYIDSADTGSDIITDFELGEGGDIIDLACISSETDIPQRLSFDYIENTGEIVLGIFTLGNDAQAPGATPNSIITIQSMDDLSLVTLESLRATDQLIVGG